MTEIPREHAERLALDLHEERLRLLQEAKRMSYDDLRRWEYSLRLIQIDKELRVVTDRARLP